MAEVEELSNAFGPSGFEDEVVDVITKYAVGFDVEVGPMNNATHV